MDECKGRIKFLMNVQLFECKSIFPWVFLELTDDYHPVCWLDSSNRWPHEFLTSALFWYCLENMCIAMQTTGSTYGLMITLVEMLNFLRYLLFMFTILVFGNIYEMKEVVVSVHELQGFAQRHLVMKVYVHFRAVICLKLRSHTQTHTLSVSCFEVLGDCFDCVWCCHPITRDRLWCQNKTSILICHCDVESTPLRILSGCCWAADSVSMWVRGRVQCEPNFHHNLIPTFCPLGTRWFHCVCHVNTGWKPSSSHEHSSAQDVALLPVFAFGGSPWHERVAAPWRG